MIKKVILSLIVLIVAANTSYAETRNGERHLSLGVGAYSQIFSFNAPNMPQKAPEHSKFGGGGLSLTLAMGKCAAVRASAYQLEEMDNNDSIQSNALSINGGEVLLLIGANFTKPGGNMYLGIGSFSEKLKIERLAFSDTYSGLMGSLGFGYNWDLFVLDFHINAKDTEDLKESVLHIPDNVDVSNISVMLSIGIRF